MERKIGEIFEFGGEWYQCIIGCHCGYCAFCNNNCEERERITLGNKLTKEETTGFCTPEFREDGKSVIFKKLEKVGEPFERNGYMYQEYKAHTYPLLMSGGAKIPTDNGFAVIIKQNKEDMEEKKPTYEELLHYYHATVGLLAIDKNPQEVSLDWICDNAFQLGIDEKDSNSENIGKNLREFNLEAAKAGKPVCTRDGRKARIICFDRRLFWRNVSYPILALVERSDGEDDVCGYNEKGKVLIEDGAEYKDDLMMLPEKKEGWVNVYKGIDGITLSRHPHASKEKAIEEAGTLPGRIDTVKISWEE